LMASRKLLQRELEGALFLALPSQLLRFPAPFYKVNQ